MTSNELEVWEDMKNRTKETAIAHCARKRKRIEWKWITDATLNAIERSQERIITKWTLESRGEAKEQIEKRGKTWKQM